MDDIILRMKGITKRFPGVVALDNVNVELRRGEVLTLLGENGAGKSTLLKILSGVYTVEEGEIIIDGETITHYNAKVAKEKGVSIIYQELNFFGELSVAENILVDNLPCKGFTRQIDWKQVNKDAKAVLDRLGVDIDPTKHMGELSVAEQQLVEIAKAFSANMKLLIMDEPTSALNEEETQNLIRLTREMAAKGVAVIFISHKLEEVFLVSDRVQVLRDGVSVALVDIKETSREALVHFMVGRKITDMYPKGAVEIGTEAFRVENLSSGRLNNINFYVNKGEILGVYGLLGSGRTELANALFGDAKSSGNIYIEGKKVNIHNTSAAIKHGIAYTPSERKREGLVLPLNVLQNITLSSIDELQKGLMLDVKEENRIAEKWKEALDIRTPEMATLVELLSGGNQQKVVIAKWLQTNPKVLILNEPTRGIDVGAKVEIYKIMESLCQQGISIIMVSSELPETMGITDRMLIFSDGRVVGEVMREDYEQHEILNMAVGGV